MSLTIGLTGGIGSGKTTASDYFASLGITIVDADICSRIVVEKGRPALSEIEKHFGKDILTASGELDRHKLRTLIFSDPKEKLWLENLLHPLIYQETLLQLKAAKSPYVILVSPLLTETGQHNIVDRILVIDTPEKTQCKRVMARDNNPEDQVKSIIKTQLPRSERNLFADDIILNDSSINDLHKKIDLLHKQYLALAKSSKAQ